MLFINRSSKQLDGVYHSVNHLYSLSSLQLSTIMKERKLCPKNNCMWSF